MDLTAARCTLRSPACQEVQCVASAVTHTGDARPTRPPQCRIASPAHMRGEHAGASVQRRFVGERCTHALALAAQRNARAQTHLRLR